MKNPYLFRKSTIVMIAFLIYGTITIAQSITIDARTVTYAGAYAPRHVFAMWITSSTGVYVNTINRQASIPNYATYLNAWKAIAPNGLSNVDGVTGASLTVHNQATVGATGTAARFPFTWDCKDKNGVIVPDGNYRLYIEFTEANAAGKMMPPFTFYKGGATQTYTRANVTTNPGKYFQDVTVTYNAPVVGLSETDFDKEYTLLHSIGTKQVVIKYDEELHPSPSLAIYNTGGGICPYKIIRSGKGLIEINVEAIVGVEIIRITDRNNRTVSKKFIL